MCEKKCLVIENALSVGDAMSGVPAIPPKKVLERMIGKGDPDAVWYCKNCKAKNPIKVSFCAKCGMNAADTRKK